MITFTKLAAALFIVGINSAANASEVKEAWEIQIIGFENRPSVTVQVIRIEDRIFLDASSILELGFPKEKIDLRRRYEITELGYPKIDTAASSIRLQADAMFLAPTRFDLGRHNTEVGEMATSLTELVVNYEANTTTEDRGSAGLLMDASLYLAGKYRVNNRGVLTANRYQSGSKWTRVETSITYEDPVETYSWTLGDAISSHGTGVSPVSFTGFQYKKNYALQPGFVLQPVTELRGSASMPSVLEVYLDNRRILSNNIPAGPFSVGNLIPQIGSNDARVIVRDSLGQEQVLTQSLFGSPGLLKPGYDNYAFQAGRLRTGTTEHQGVFASGFYSAGISNTFTVEVNGDASQKSARLPAVHHVGVSLLSATKLGSFSAGVRAGTGSSVTLGYGNGWRDGERSARINASTTRNSDDYLVLGAATSASKSTSAIQGTLQWSAGKSVALYMLKDDQASNRGVALTFNPTVQYRPSYSITFDRSSYSTVRRSTIAVSMSVPFDMGMARRTQSVSSSVRYQDESSLSNSVNFSNSTLNQTGVNYYGQVERSRDYVRADATMAHISHSGEQGLSVASFNGKADARGRMRGSAIIGRGGVNFNRWLTGGYARVESDIPDVDIFVNGSPYGRTNDSGVGYVPVLTSYTNTSLSLDPDSSESVDSAPVSVMVRPQGGVVAKFSRVTGAFVSVEGVQDGTLTVNDNVYPITDRGAYLELPEGNYIGKLNSGRSVSFTIPKPGKDLVQRVLIK
jgi:outer membrane usher protein FimD/PapC